MELLECYQLLGGNFAQAKKRMMKESLIRTFIEKFLNDRSFSELLTAMEEGQREKAFLAAHTLKGVCANLSFDRLFSSAAQLTELLRSESESISKDAYQLFENVAQDYALTTDAILSYLSHPEA